MVQHNSMIIYHCSNRSYGLNMNFITKDTLEVFVIFNSDYKNRNQWFWERILFFSCVFGFNRNHRSTTLDFFMTQLICVYIFVSSHWYVIVKPSQCFLFLISTCNDFSSNKAFLFGKAFQWTLDFIYVAIRIIMSRWSWWKYLHWCMWRHES